MDQITIVGPRMGLLTVYCLWGGVFSFSLSITLSDIGVFEIDPKEGYSQRNPEKAELPVPALCRSSKTPLKDIFLVRVDTPFQSTSFYFYSNVLKSDCL